MSFIRLLVCAVVAVCCLLLGAGQAVGAPTVYAVNSTLYSFESPVITTPDPSCGSQWPGFCTFAYAANLPPTSADQPWSWSTDGGIATRGSAWDPAGQNGPSPPNGNQFAFIQTKGIETSYMVANVQLTLGRLYYVNYSIASRGSGYTIASGTQFTVSYDGGVFTQLSSGAPATNQQWSDASNPRLSSLFTGSSVGTLKFTMTVPNAGSDLDQAVVIDAVSVLPLAVVPSVKYSFEVPVQTSPDYFTYNVPLAIGQPFTWTAGAGGIAAKISPWYPADGNPYDGNQWAYLQTITTNNHQTFSCNMTAYVSLQPNTAYGLSFRAGYRFQTDNLDSAVLSVYIVPIGGPLNGAAQTVYRKAPGVSIDSAWNTYTSSASFITRSYDATLIFAIDSPTTGVYDKAWLVDAVTISPA